jgi:MFS family permease
VQWVATGYLLPFGLAVPVSGWAAERLGAKRVWIAALLLFLLGSMLGGLAWNLPSLIGFRVLEGFAAGFSLPVLQTLLLRAAGSGDKLGRLMAVAATRIAQQIGASFGAAVIVVILARQTAVHPGTAGAAVAFGHAFGWALGFTVLALLPAFALPRRPRATR